METHEELLGERGRIMAREGLLLLFFVCLFVSDNYFYMCGAIKWNRLLFIYLSQS